MSDVVLMDTSVFCELLQVPGKSNADRHQQTRDFLAEGAREGLVFLLPWATVLETGNHIGQVADGTLRRRVAKLFVDAVGRSLNGDAPWSPSGPLTAERMASLLRKFVEWSTRYESGLGDLSIVDEWEHQCAVNPNRRVWVWSLDGHFAAYDRKI